MKKVLNLGPGYICRFSTFLFVNIEENRFKFSGKALKKKNLVDEKVPRF